MKKIQLLVIASALTTVSFAQFQKNDRLLSGQIFF